EGRPAMTTAPAQSYRYVLMEIDGPIAYVTMNRPEKRNALSVDHMQELIACFTAIGERQDVAVVILRGNGPAFCSGHDLREMVGGDPAFYRHVFDVCTRLMETIQGIPQPVIAQVHGIATAAGCQLVATCDLVVAAEDARFATPGVKIGLFCSTPMVAITRVVGRKRAMQMLLTGVAIDAATAADWGLVNEVVPADRLEARTLELAVSSSAASSVVTVIGKAAFHAQIDSGQLSAYDYAQAVMT